jgi:hypothetical protein
MVVVAVLIYIMLALEFAGSPDGYVRPAVPNPLADNPARRATTPRPPPGGRQPPPADTAR